MDLPPWIWPRAAYVHVPFCAHHCGYCDFAVAVGQDDRIDQYLDALTLDLSRLGKAQAIDTLVLGGGTPSYLNPDQLQRLLQLLAGWLSLRPSGEFSIEANPDDITMDKVALWADHGVSRVSLGAQSFNPDVLRVLERRHAPEQVPRAVELVKRRIAQVSLDLIFGAPGQTLEQWLADLRSAIALQPDHISIYGLTFEKGTRLWKQRREGTLQSLDEETELEMYQAAREELSRGGFEHYEISNFARPGARSGHNQVYWANEAYFGFGLGAASYVEGVRRHNIRDLESYLRRALSGQPLHRDEECLPPRERAFETIGTKLRRREGIVGRRFQEQTGFVLEDLVGDRLQRLIDLELLLHDEDSVRLTPQGQCVADAVITELMKG